MKGKMHNGAIQPLYQMARELRNRSTHAEMILRGYLKAKPLGIKFRRQHPYSIYILDFYCHSLKLVIEVDGSIHNEPEMIIHDKKRQDDLEKDGLSVIRFTNNEVENKLEKVQQTIENFILKNKDDK